MTASKMPRPRPAVLTPEEKARVIDARNEQADTRTVQDPKAAPKPTAAKRS